MCHALNNFRESRVGQDYVTDFELADKIIILGDGSAIVQPVQSRLVCEVKVIRFRDKHFKLFTTSKNLTYPTHIVGKKFGTGTSLRVPKLY